MLTGLDIRERLEARIAELPTGYISEKNINGKKRYYLQWREGGKLKSKYIRVDELEVVKKQIAERKELEERLKEMKIRYPKRGEEVVFETPVRIGKDLEEVREKVKGKKKRYVYKVLSKYLYSDDYTKVCAIYGLRRTGKTTMLFQAIADMSEEDFARTAYIKIKKNNNIDMVMRDVQKLKDAGYKYIFIDEVTLMEDFIDSASVFSDIYAIMGMKIVLSGTDSLGFWLARDNELYDRVVMVHTTFIPYREYSELLDINSVDEYIRYGGTLLKGETDFDDEELKEEEVGFRDDETTRRYVDTAISKNIQHSLACFEYGKYFGHLFDLYEAKQLTGAINRIIEDINHRFVYEVLTRDFVSHDLGNTASNLRRDHNPEMRMNLYECLNKETVTQKLMELLEIENREQQSIGITNSHITAIKMYLKGLDLILDCPIEYGELGIEEEEYTLFTQPGMRYCQAQALAYSVMKDEKFRLLDEDVKENVVNKILETVRGRMLEDIIILETSKALGKRYRVFKLKFESGEFDMVIRDKENNACAIYEVKHSKECVREQAKHLLNEDKLKLTTPRFGTLEGRYVLYLGEDLDTEDGIAYRNAEAFLKNLPNISLCSGLEETQTDGEDQGFRQTL